MKRMLSLFCAVALAAALCVPAAAADLKPIGAETALRSPSGLLVTKAGTLYVTDRERNQVLYLQNGNVQVAAGYMLPEDNYGKPTGGHLDSVAAKALFNGPTAMVEWMDGIVVSDTENHCLRLIKNGEVRTLAGVGREGMQNGAANRGRFSRPIGLAVDDKGDLYIADSGNGVIRKLTAKGQLSTYATGFEMPAGLCWFEGALYVTDAGSNRILKVANGKTEIVAGASQRIDSEWSSGFSDGSALKATFFQPMDLLVTKDAIYIADTGNSAVRALRDGRVSTLACRSSEKDLWPTEPVSLELIGDTLYVADRFSGGIYSMKPGNGTYLDVKPTDSCYAAVKAVSNRGLMNGTSAEYFSPNGSFTRAMMAVILMRYEASRDRDMVLTGERIHTDITDTTWYGDAAAWISGTGMMTGYTDGRFGGYHPLSRQQCIAVLYRYAERLGYDMTGRDDLSAFQDVGAVGDYALEPMRWAVANGIIPNDGTGILAPSHYVTRAEFCVYLHRWFTLMDQ